MPARSRTWRSRSNTSTASPYLKLDHAQFHRLEAGDIRLPSGEAPGFLLQGETFADWAAAAASYNARLKEEIFERKWRTREKSVQVGDILDIPFPLAFQGGNGKDNAVFEFYSAPAFEDDKVFLVHFADLEEAQDYFATVAGRVGRAQGAPQEGVHGQYFSRQGLEGQMTELPAVAVNEKALARRVKDHVLGSSHDFFAVVHPGFEATARQELRELGIAAPRIAGSGGIAFSGKLDDAWRVNLGAGTVSRVLMRLGRVQGHGFRRIPRQARRLSLGTAPRRPCPGRLLHPGGPLAAVARRQARRGGGAGHRGAPGRLWPPGVVPRKGGWRPRRAGKPSFCAWTRTAARPAWIRAASFSTAAATGNSWKQAPLRETLACSVLRAAAIERYRVVIDPFCGSGTFALEAGAIFSGRPVNCDRAFAFQGWPSFRPARFQHLKDELEKEFTERAPAGAHKIYCSDIDPKAVATARHNLEHAGLAPLAEVDQADFFHLHPPACDPAGVLLVMNPPYGARQEQGATSPPSTGASAKRSAATTPAAATPSSFRDWSWKKRWDCRTRRRSCFTMAEFRWPC